MKPRLITNLITVLAISLVAIVAADKSPAAPSTSKQDGVWKPISVELGGSQLPKEALDAITLKISGETYEVILTSGQESDRGSCKTDDTTNPKRLTIVSASGPNKGKTMLGIYEMKDTNSFRVCYDLTGKEFPKEFAAPKDTELLLIDYRRQTTEKRN